MVSFEPVYDEPAPPHASQERMADADEIEQLAVSAQRVSVKIHLESLAKKLRKESEALNRVEKSQAQSTTTSSSNNLEADSMMGDVESPSAPAAAVPVTTPTPQSMASAPPPPAITARYISIDRFSFDAGGSNAPFVTIYVTLPSVGSIPRAQIECNFTKTSFDLVVNNLQGKSYRLFKDSLEKNINPGDCKVVVKADKIVLKLAKIKGEYGSYDYWSKLVDTKKDKTAEKKSDPQDSIMQMMKDMYDQGDDKMKKMIGETMMKQRSGELDKPDYSKGGMGMDMDM